MATVRSDITTTARPGDVWAAIADIGALHTRLVPGFVVATQLDGDARIVTFGNGAVVREPIVTVDAEAMRLVWTAEGGLTRHYNASVQVFAARGGSKVVWIADFLPDAAKPAISAAIASGMAVIKTTLDRLG